jgi:hypothetical protein
VLEQPKPKKQGTPPLETSKRVLRETNTKTESLVAGQKRTKAVSENVDMEEESVHMKKNFGNVIIEMPKFKRVNKAKLKEF